MTKLRPTGVVSHEGRGFMPPYVFHKPVKLVHRRVLGERGERRPRFLRSDLYSLDRPCRLAGWYLCLHNLPARSLAVHGLRDGLRGRVGLQHHRDSSQGRRRISSSSRRPLLYIERNPVPSGWVS